LINSDLSDKDIEWLETLQSLRILGIERNSAITDVTLKRISKLTNLTELTLDQVSITDDGIEMLTALRSLERLMIFNTRITGKTLSVFSRSLLTDLSLSGNHLTDEAFTEIAKCRGLRKLTLHKTTLSPEGLEKLLCNVSLTNLSLEELPVDFAMAHIISSQKSIQVLDVGEIDQSGLTEIGKNANLRSLGINGARLSAKDVLQMGNLQLLERISISSPKWTDEDYDAVRTAAPNLKVFR
jgi:Leucine-rich repeat (LRR) protein